MTDKEIKLELAKAALSNGSTIEAAKKFYEWIMEVTEHEEPESEPMQWDDTPIEDLAYRTRIKGTIIKRCKDNGINTVGELIRCGYHKFFSFKNVGAGTMTAIDDVLEQHYGIVDWYKT